MKIKFITLLCCTLFVGSCAFSQVKTTIVYQKYFLNSCYTDTFKKMIFKITPSMLVSPSFYSSNLAFFCRQEIKFEKVTKIPFKFRLGSVQQVDFLEGKKR